MTHCTALNCVTHCASLGVCVTASVLLYVVSSTMVFMLKPVATDKRICPKPCLVYTFHTHNDDHDDVDGGGSDRHHDSYSESIFHP